MKQTPETIRKKWEIKLQDISKTRDYQAHYQIEQARDKLYHATEIEFERKKAQILRKAESFKKKKAEEYRKKCENEIRKLQGKEPKQYKTKALRNTQKIQIALAILQENVRLRDTDENGNGYCISCDKKCTWEELAGGHWYTRQLISICLRPENVNAQCHKCNYATGPKGNALEKERINQHYKENLIKKYGENIVAEMEARVREELKNPHKYRLMGPYIDELVPELIAENKRLWDSKGEEFRFSHKPAKNRQKVYEKYRHLSNN